MVKATKEMFSKYAVFNGRTSRADFCCAILGYFLLTVIVAFIAGLIMGTSSSTEPTTSIPIVAIWSLATLLPALGLEIRRLHDINKSGWWILISLVPFVGGIILLVFYCLPAVNEGNNY